MKPLIFTTLALILASTSAWSAPAAKSAPKKAAAARVYKLDSAASTLAWRASKVTGKHDGAIQLKSGVVELQGDDVKSGQFEIDMTTIANRDIEDATYKKKLEDHLRSDDFFSVAKHPTAAFKLTQVKTLPKTAPKGTHEVTGDLTIKGITHPVTFLVVVKQTGDKIEANGTVTVDRTKYDVRYGSGKFFQGLGDKMIHDDFMIDLKLVGSTS